MEPILLCKEEFLTGHVVCGGSRVHSVTIPSERTVGFTLNIEDAFLWIMDVMCERVRATKRKTIAEIKRAVHKARYHDRGAIKNGCSFLTDIPTQL